MDLLNTSRAHKTAFFGAFARVGKALAHPARLELLDLLSQSPRTVDELARASAQSIANTSQHLQSLHRAGLVRRTREGLYVRYTLSSDAVADLCRALRVVAESELAEVEQAAHRFLRDDAVESIGSAELRARVREGRAIVIDVRPAEEYAAAHLPGSVSIPLEELAKRLSTLPKRKEIVAYCRGPYCVLSLEAVRVLRASGRRARRLEDGVHEWRARGFPVEQSGAPR
jgi:rhodanese-related sulfurtransferase/DNA-binding transcriptional ArsR family regulator